MEVVALIEPPQADVIERILRHCGLWRSSAARAPPAEDRWVHPSDADADSHPASCDELGELKFVNVDTFEVTL